jgi:hypothetical protein
LTKATLRRCLFSSPTAKIGQDVTNTYNRPAQYPLNARYNGTHSVIERYQEDMMRSLLPLLFLAAGSAAAAQQDVYKWTDDEGVTHYSDPKSASQQAKPVVLPPLDTVVSLGLRPPPADPSLEVLPGEAAELNQPVEPDEFGMPEVSAEFEESTELSESDFAAIEFQGQTGEPVRDTAPVRHEISLYRWTDAKGVAHYGNQPPGNVGANELHLEPPAENVIREGSGKP